MKADLIEAIRTEILVGADGDIGVRKTAAKILDLVLDALREPTDEMIEATGSEYGVALEETWQKMIDAFE